MIATLKAELRKVLTVRSTYGVLFFIFMLLMIFSFYFGGIHTDPKSVVVPGLLANEVVNAVAASSLFISIVGVLLMTHEYRYNTITYTLTASKSRLRVLLAKIVVISAFSLLIASIVGVLAPCLAYLGLTVKGLHLTSQVFSYGDLIWRCLFVAWGYSMIALLAAAAIRNQVGVLATIFLFQGTVEPLLGLMLKSHAAYLPYRALNAVLQPVSGDLSYTRGALVFMAYLVVGWIVAAVLFVKRDATS